MSNFLEENPNRNPRERTQPRRHQVSSAPSTVDTVAPSISSKKLADFRYDSSYGSAEIPEDLVIVFSDGSWLERGEYDGSEWWAYKKAPTVPDSYEPIVNLDQRAAADYYPQTVAACQQLAEE